MQPSLTEEEYAAVEHAVYEAAVIPELWPGVLANLGTLTDTAGGAFACVNERGAHIVCAPIMDVARKRILDEGYLYRSGRAQGVISKGLLGTPRFANEYDYYNSLEDAETDPIVAEVFRREGLGWAAGWLLQLPHGDMLIMNVEQYFERGPITGNALARLDSLYSVFASAAMLSSRLDFERVRTAIETLTAVGLPAAAVTPAARVVLANDAFSSATHVWTTRGGDKLGLLDRVADRMLGEALASLSESRGPRSIPIRTENRGAVSAVLQVVPIRRAAHDVFGSTSAIVVLSQPKTQASDPSIIQSLFDLTPAEIAVAQSIAAGLTQEQIAKLTGRSVLTIRNQLKSVMAKTGCSRQVELVILMNQLVGVKIAP